MGRYAREPLAWHRRLRYRIGRVLCGRRPFAPWLEREQWQSVCLNRAAAPTSRPAGAVARRRLVPR
jgi:hypothetical protein